jgi:hypothetical protein
VAALTVVGSETELILSGVAAIQKARNTDGDPTRAIIGELAASIVPGQGHRDVSGDLHVATNQPS